MTWEGYMKFLTKDQTDAFHGILIILSIFLIPVVIGLVLYSFICIMAGALSVPLTIFDAVLFVTLIKFF